MTENQSRLWTKCAKLNRSGPIATPPKGTRAEPYRWSNDRPTVANPKGSIEARAKRAPSTATVSVADFCRRRSIAVANFFSSVNWRLAEHESEQDTGTLIKILP
jgi:hypothetical protein